MLRWDAQGAIEFTGSVFPGDRSRQLYQCILIVKSAQSREKFVADLATRYCHSVGKLERGAFGFGKQVIVCVVSEAFDLVVGNSQAAAHGSINVLSKLTTV